MRCEATHWGQIILYNLITSGILSVVGMFFLSVEICNRLRWCYVLAVYNSNISNNIIIDKNVANEKSAKEISNEFSEKLKDNTNTLISISTNDRALKELANNLNIQLKDLQKQRHRFQQGDLELKSAVTNISHDLRTPLTAISGYLDLLDNTEKVKRWSVILK